MTDSLKLGGNQFAVTVESRNPRVAAVLALRAVEVLTSYAIAEAKK